MEWNGFSVDNWAIVSITMLQEERMMSQEQLMYHHVSFQMVLRFKFLKHNETENEIDGGNVHRDLPCTI
jgi:hypothetical protein